MHGFSGITPAGNAPTGAGSYNSNNQITTGSATFDAAGNQTFANGNTLAYDAENRQISETDGTTKAVTNYIYDGDGRRVEKIGPNATIVYVYDVRGVLASEYSTAANNSTCTTCYLFWDQLGTVRLVTDQNASIVARHDYLPFGEEILAGQAGRGSQWGTGNDNVNQKFTANERDSESGLDFFHARYYGAALGRFASTDPENAGADASDPQTWNAYAYVRNAPLTLTDPDGLDPGDDPCYGHSRPCWSATVTAKIEDLAVQSIVRIIDLGQKTNQAEQNVWDWISKPRNPTCLSASTAAGASAGAAIGMLGVVGGPTVGATEPSAVAIGGGAGWLSGMISCMSSSGSGGGGGDEGGGEGAKRTSVNQMQKQVERGQAPKSVDRIDKGLGPFEKDHVEFKDGNALNYDGTWKHGGRALTNVEKDWLESNGWTAPK